MKLALLLFLAADLAILHSLYQQQDYLLYLQHIIIMPLKIANQPMQQQQHAHSRQPTCNVSGQPSIAVQLTPAKTDAQPQQQVVTSTNKTQAFKTATLVTVLTSLLLITGLLLFIVQIYHLRDTYTPYPTANYPIDGRSIAYTPYEYQHKSFTGQNIISTGQFIAFPTANAQQSTAIPQMMTVDSNQTGLTLIKINDNNFIIQVDPQALVAYYDKTHPAQTKRMLAQLYLTRNLEQVQQQHHSFQSQQLRNKIVEKICDKTKMNTNNTIFKELDYHVATRTDQGFILSREHTPSSRLLELASGRQLFFYDMYLAYLMAANTQQMVDAANQIQKAQQQQQANQQNGQQPVTVITVINIVNNSNVVINLNSSNNVVINNNNNKQVNIVKGNNQPTISNQSQAQGNTSNQAQNNNNNNPAQNNNKRMLTEEGQLQNQQNDDNNAISKAAFQYAALCIDVGPNKYCPAGYFHRPNSPFKLAEGELERGVEDVRRVRRMVIGSQVLLSMDQLGSKMS